MTEKQRDAEAGKLEALEKAGDSESMKKLAGELHSIKSVDDRKAIAERLEKYGLDHPSLPKLEFYDNSGDLKSVKTKSDDGKTTTTVNEMYDQTTGTKTSVDTVQYDYSSGNTISEQTTQYDPITGKRIADFYNDKDVRYEDVSDRVTGNPIVEDRVIKRNGFHEHIEYDRSTGNETVLERETQDSKDHVEYDPKTKAKVYEKSTDKYGTTDDIIFDPDTGNHKADHIVFKQGSVKEEWLWWDDKGQVKEVDYKDQDGKLTQWKR